MKALPKLFKQTSAGADQEWQVAVEGNVIVSRWGQCGGAIQETRDTIREGKNVGRSNATTPEQQAAVEAEALWNKKLKRGYVKDLGAARAGIVDAAIAGGWWPMLAKSYKDEGDKIVWPAWMQRKLNGHRVSAHVKNRKATLWSRKRNIITGVPHINRALEELVPDDDEYRFDGEGYNHAWHDEIEKLSHFLRSPEPQEGHEVVEYHVYDMNHPGGFAERLALRDRILRDLRPGDGSPIVAVETAQIADETEALDLLETFLRENYEGGILRNAAGAYKAVSATARSDDLQKLKRFMDSEFKIVAIGTGRGKDEGVAIFECELPDKSATFKVKKKGSYDEQRSWYENREQLIGKQLTVKYPNLTKKTGKPFHPVAWRFREDL